MAATATIATLEAAREELKAKDVSSAGRISALEAELAASQEGRDKLAKQLDEANAALRAVNEVRESQ